MALTQREIRERALAFAHDWADASRERAESQTFWNEFFNIFGITRRRVASFEEPVPRPGRAPGSIDLLKTPDQFSVREAPISRQHAGNRQQELGVAVDKPIRRAPSPSRGTTAHRS